MARSQGIKAYTQRRPLAVMPAFPGIHDLPSAEPPDVQVVDTRPMVGHDEDGLACDPLPSCPSSGIHDFRSAAAPHDQVVDTRAKARA